MPDKKYSYENLLKTMMDSVPDKYDKREGSVLFNTIAPNAMALSQIYDLIEYYTNNVYPNTADRAGLIKALDAKGIYYNRAINAVILGRFYADIEKKVPFNPTSGDTFYLEGTELIYKVTYKKSDGLWSLQCTTPGEVGNVANGKLIPLKSMGGNFAGSEVESISVYGAEAESTESLRNKLIASYNSIPYGGNRDFYDKAMDQFKNRIEGFRLYVNDEGKLGHISMFICGKNFTVPDASLIMEIQDYIDPTGQLEDNPDGYWAAGGVAPINQKVHVKQVESGTIRVNAEVKSSKSVGELEKSLRPILNEFLKQTNQSWKSDNGIVFKTKVLKGMLLTSDDVNDITHVTVEYTPNSGIGGGTYTDESFTLVKNEICDPQHVELMITIEPIV